MSLRETLANQVREICCPSLFADYGPVYRAGLVASAALIAESPELAAVEAKEGPLNAERMTLDELLEILAKWKAVASGKTCVSFENICYGASSLWHQTHRENFRKIASRPEALSRWVLEHASCVMEDFPAQVLCILEELKQQVGSAEAERAKLRRDAAKWRAFCAGWTDDDENGVSTWQGYTISHWTGEAWGPDGFRFDEGDIEAAKVACLEHFKGRDVE